MRWIERIVPALRPGDGARRRADGGFGLRTGAHPHSARQRALQILATFFSLLILALSAFVVTRTLLTMNFSTLRATIHLISLEQLLLAVGFTACSYLALTGYDACALRQLRLKVPYAITALASFSSYAISFTMGFALVTGGTVRYWIYSQVGLRASHVLSLTLIAGVTFWLGMILVLGLVLVLMPGPVAAINHLQAWLNWALGLFALLCVLAWIFWVSLSTRRIVVRGIHLELPGLRITLAQVLLGAVDLFFAAAALYVLLPEGHGLGFITFAGVYVFACLLGVASNAPGGIGAFEATILKTVPTPSVEALLAALVLFRIIYYFIPFVLAFALLGANEITRRWRRLRRDLDANDRPY